MFFVVVIGSLILGIIGMFCPDHLGRGLGEALFISGFLALTVDLFVKRRLAREVSQDVIFSALGYHVPPEMREEIRVISSYRVIRHGVELTYKITPYEASKDYVWVDSELEFEVRNLTDSPEPFRHLLWVNKPFHLDAAVRQLVYAKAIGVETGRAYELSGDDLPQTDVPGEHAVEWCRTENIPARGKARYWSRTRQILPAEHVDVFMLVQPSIDVKVRLDAASSLICKVNFAHRRNEEKEVAGGNTWRLSCGFAPFSAVTIEWRKRSASVPPPSTATAAAPPTS